MFISVYDIETQNTDVQNQENNDIGEGKQTIQHQ